MKRNFDRSLPVIVTTHLTQHYREPFDKKKTILTLESSNLFPALCSACHSNDILYDKLEVGFFINFIKILKSSSVFLPYFVSTQEIESHPTPV